MLPSAATRSHISVSRQKMTSEACEAGHFHAPFFLVVDGLPILSALWRGGSPTIKTRAGAALQHARLSASHKHDISRRHILVVRTVETQSTRRGFKIHPRPFQAQLKDRCPTIPPHITHTSVLCTFHLAHRQARSCRSIARWARPRPPAGLAHSTLATDWHLRFLINDLAFLMTNIHFKSDST